MKIRQKAPVPLGWNDVDTVDQRFRFVLNERATGDRTYEWELSGTYFVDDGEVGIASLNRSRPDETAGVMVDNNNRVTVSPLV